MPARAYNETGLSQTVQSVQKGIFTMSNPVVTITMEDGSVMKAELYPEIAPNTVRNFISLIRKGFYQRPDLSRVIPGFMIQGGCPQGTGTGGPGYSIKGEFAQNGVKNDLKHTEGVLSMAGPCIRTPPEASFLLCTKTRPIWTELTRLSEKSRREWMWWIESPIHPPISVTVRKRPRSFSP